MRFLSPPIFDPDPDPDPDFDFDFDFALRPLREIMPYRAEDVIYSPLDFVPRLTRNEEMIPATSPAVAVKKRTTIADISPDNHKKLTCQGSRFCSTKTASKITMVRSDISLAVFIFRVPHRPRLPRQDPSPCTGAGLW